MRVRAAVLVVPAVVAGLLSPVSVGVSTAAVDPGGTTSTGTASLPVAGQSRSAQDGLLPVSEPPAAGAADGEVVAWRTERSRTVVDKTTGGYRTELSAAPLHVKDAEGSWQRLDLALVADGPVLRPRKAGVPLEVPVDAAGTVRAGVPGRQVTLRLDGATGRASSRASAARWERVRPQVDWEVVAKPDGFEDTVTLGSAQAPSEVQYTLGVPAGATAQLRAGAVEVRDAAGEQVAVMAPAEMTDAAGARTGKVAYELAMLPSGGYRLTMTPDRAWLSEPARVWPVRVDPYVRLSGPSGNAALRIDGRQPATALSGQYLAVGFDGGQTNRTLAKFDVHQIPTDAVVTQAQFVATTAGTNAAPGSVQPDNVVQLRAMSRDWTAAASWNSPDGVQLWSSPGGDTDGSPVWTQSMGGAPGASTAWPVTQLVRDWVDGSRANFGLQLRTTPETWGPDGQSRMNYLPPIDDPDRGPRLFVDWTPRLGTGPGVFTRTLTDRLELEVNVTTGNLLVQSTDVELAGPGEPLKVVRSYNSRGPDGVLGASWTLSPGPDVRWNDAGDSLVWHSPDGRREPFTMSQDGTQVTSPYGLRADARLNPDRSGTITEHETGRVLTFAAPSPFERNVNCLRSVTDRNGNGVTVGYSSSAGPDACPLMTSLTNAAGRVVTVTSSGTSSEGRYTGLSDATGRAVTYAYTGALLTAVTDAEGGITRYGYDSAGRLTEITTPAGRVTKVSYDSDSRVTGLQQLTDTAAGTGPTYLFSHYGSPVRGGNSESHVDDPRGGRTKYFGNRRGEMIGVIDPLGRHRQATYSPTGRPASSTDALGATSTSSYDTRGNRTGTQAAAPAGQTGRTTAATYPPVTGSSPYPAGSYLPATSTDEQGNTSSYTYDGPGNLMRTSTAAPNGAVEASYTRNGPAGTAPTCGGKPGQVCTAVDGNTNTTRFTYNTSGDLTAVDNPAPLGDTTSSYDTLGRQTADTDGKGQTTRTSYDRLDRVTQVLYGGATVCDSTAMTAGRCLQYSYDSDGNRTSQTDTAGTISYGYDGLGRQTSKTLPGQPAQTLSYDEVGNTTSATDPGGTTGYTYDNANQLIALAEPGSTCPPGTASAAGCTRFGYNSNGVRTSTTYPTGSTATVMSMTPDVSGRVGAIKAVTGATVHSDLTYTYATPAGADSALTTTRRDAQTGRTTRYSHDTLNRLTAATETDPAGATTAAWAYSYDRAGNRTSASLTGAPGAAPTTFGYNAANQLISRNGSTTGFGYDLNGNETAAVGASTRNSSFTTRDQLASLTTNGSTTPFAYAGDSQLERTSRGTTTFTSSATGLATETTAGATSSFIRDPQGTLVALRTAAGSFYYLLDGLGSVTGLVNTTGAKVNSYSYDPYGISRTKTEQVPNPFQYTGGYLDTATGLYKLGIRYYDPTLGRFTQPDPTGQDSRYTYAGNNPCTFVDPGGARRSLVGRACQNRAGVVFREVFGPIATGAAVFGFARDLADYQEAREWDFKTLRQAVRRQAASVGARTLAKGALPVALIAGGGELGCLAADAYDSRRR